MENELIQVKRQLEISLNDLDGWKKKYSSLEISISSYRDYEGKVVLLT